MSKKSKKKTGGRSASGKSKLSKIRKILAFLKHKLKTKHLKKKLLKIRKKIKLKKKKSKKKR